MSFFRSSCWHSRMFRKGNTPIFVQRKYRKVFAGLIIFLAVFFGAQSLGALFLSPAYADDMAISATVLPPPSPPLVSGVAICVSGHPVLRLDWADDPASSRFDILRNGTPLLLQTSQSYYEDAAVTPGVSYMFSVRAYGPMAPGIASSAPVFLEAPRNCSISIIPTVSLETVGGVPVGSLAAASISTGTPTFLGTSNMASAPITIALVGPLSFFASLTSREDGSWSWEFFDPLPPGTYSVSVSVSHPNDSSQRARDHLFLTVLSEAKSKNEETKKKNNDTRDTKGARVVPTPRSSATPPNVPIPDPHKETPKASEQESAAFPEAQAASLPATLTLNLSSDQELLSSEQVSFVFMPTDLSESWRGKSVAASFEILNEQGERVSSGVLPDIFLVEGIPLSVTLPFPLSLPPGEYRVRVSLEYAGVHGSVEKVVRLPKRSFLTMGQGVLLSRKEAARLLAASLPVSAPALASLVLLPIFEWGMFVPVRGRVTIRNVSRFLRRKGVIRL